MIDNRVHQEKWLEQPPNADFDLVEMVKKRLGFSDEEFVRLMTQPMRGG